MNNLSMVFERLADAGLRLKPAKCKFLRNEVPFLGHIISESGIRTDPQKTETVKNWPTPVSTVEVQQFLGLASYYRRFIHHFADIAKPLHCLTQKDFKFVWTTECQSSFDNLRNALTTAPILAFPNLSPDAGKFVLDTDASDAGIGAVLSQLGENGSERVVAYGSRCLNKQERNYCTTRKEMLAVVFFTRQFRHFLLGRHFTVRTDHQSLRWLQNFREPEGQVARWQEQLQEFDFDCVHRPGSRHSNADSLSRRPPRNHGDCPSCCEADLAAISLNTSNSK